MHRIDVNATDRNLRVWLNAGPVDRAVGDGLTFVASEASARQGKASWILRYRFGGRQKEKVIGRYPDIPLKDARALARKDRALLQQGTDVGAAKQEQKLKQQGSHTVSGLAAVWFDRHIAPKNKHTRQLKGVIRNHIEPVIGHLPIDQVRASHVDKVLTKIVDAGKFSIAKLVRSCMHRMFHLAVRRRWIESNPVYGFDASDTGGAAKPRERWLTTEELLALGSAMRATPRFGRTNELAVWLLLALCVRKMELLAAKWSEFDLERGVWRLPAERTKTTASIEVPLAEPVIMWLHEVKALAGDNAYLFPARHHIRSRRGMPSANLFLHVSPITLNCWLKKLALSDMPHFTVHDLRRTARTHMAAMGIDRFVAERALNHKIPSIEGVYNKYDYFEERQEALSRWAKVVDTISRGHVPPPESVATRTAAKTS